jgi:hypothetical protein
VSRKSVLDTFANAQTKKIVDRRKYDGGPFRAADHEFVWLNVCLGTSVALQARNMYPGYRLFFDPDDAGLDFVGGAKSCNHSGRVFVTPRQEPQRGW